jgi:4,5:9,10-diseco-3-hydroxy-5,9,17-trioxoandrosta-1(10),2-diene-4-oate hydrolase
MAHVISTSHVIFKSLEEVAMTTDRLAALGVPEGALMVEACGVRLAVAREGRGPPVVCLHATGHGGRDFEAFAAAASDRFEVIRIDWPGQGRSDTDPKPASAARYAELLEALLPALGVEAPILLGNSIGGAAAILYASRRPVRALVLCDSGGLVEVDQEVRRFIRAFVAFFRAGARGAWWFKPLFALYYGLVLPKPAARAQRRRIVEAACDLAPVLAQSWASFSRPEADIRALAAGLDVPVWFAWARQDKVIRLARCRPAIDAMRHAAVTEFDAGHAAFLEQPQAFLEGFERFVAGLPDGARLQAVA